MPGLRILTAADGPDLETFLARHAASTLTFRSNVRASGLVDGPGPYHGAYAAKFVDGVITDVAAHYWSNNIIFYAPTAPVELATFLSQHTGRPIMGLIGPWRDCVRALDGLGFHHRTIDKPPHSEILYELPLSDLAVPQELSSGAVGYRRATADDLAVLIPWRVNYEIETLKYDPSPEVEARATETMTRIIAAKDVWVATVAGQPVAMSAFNARLPEMAQVGGVHTPRQNRGKGYARVAVAGSLIDARTEGATRGILFTEINNHAAQRVYEALGFKQIGDYGLILLHPP